MNIYELNIRELKKHSNELFESLSNTLDDEEVESLNELCECEREIARRGEE